MSARSATDQHGPTQHGPTQHDRAARADRALRQFHDEDALERVYDLRMLLKLWPFVKPHRAYLGGSLVMLLLMAVFGVLRPLVMREALNGFSSPGGAQNLVYFGVAVAVLVVFEQGLAFPQVYWVQIAGARAMADLRRHVFSFLHTRALRFFDVTPIGRLVTRVTNDVDAIGEMFASGALNATGDLIRLIAIITIMLSLDVHMSLFAFAVLPPVLLGVNWTRKRMRTSYRQVRAKTARMNAFINEQVSGIQVVQAYAKERQSEKTFDEVNQGYRVSNLQAIVLEATLDASIEMVGSVCIAAVIWYAGGLGADESVPFGTLFAFVAYIDMFFMPIRNLSARYTQIQSALAGAERVFQLLQSPDGDAEAKEGASLQLEHGARPWPEQTDVAFAFKQVCFEYNAGIPILFDIDLEATRGQTLAVVGPTGSGKSTLVGLLLRLYEVKSGSVEVFGRDVRALDRKRLRERFAVVPQDVFLFPGTVASNIAAGSEEPDRQRVHATLKKIGALKIFEDRENGIDSEVLERGSNFSAGERQLIAFARALYRDPELLILDEPTANIDSNTEAQLQTALLASMKGRTAIIIAHRLSTIRFADRIAVMKQGRIAEQGSHDELLQRGAIYAKLYRLQAARHELDERVGVALENVCAARAADD